MGSAFTNLSRTDKSDNSACASCRTGDAAIFIYTASADASAVHDTCDSASIVGSGFYRGALNYDVLYDGILEIAEQTGVGPGGIHAEVGNHMTATVIVAGKGGFIGCADGRERDSGKVYIGSLLVETAAYEFIVGNI